MDFPYGKIELFAHIGVCMKRSSWAVWILVAALIVGAFLLGGRLGSNWNKGLSDSRAAEDSHLNGSPIFSASGKTASRKGVEQPPALSPITLPPKGASVASLYRSFAARARAGDSIAACRIALDLSYCANRAKSVAVASQIATSMANGKAPSDSAINTVASVLDQADRDSEMCDGLSREAFGSAYEFQVIASVASKNLKRWLVSNPALDSQDFLNNLDKWRDYRSRAERYFDAALADRSLEDLPILLQVYAPTSVMSLRPSFRVNDEATFVSLYNVAVANGIVLPPDMVAAANQIKRSPSAPKEKSALESGWKGDAPKNFRDSVIKAMYPSSSDSFCRGG